MESNVVLEADMYELFEYMKTNNSKEFNINKCLEELVEFQEVLLKMQTKADSNPKKPTVQDAIDEFGDVLYRSWVALMTIIPDKSLDEIYDMLDDRIMNKIKKLIEWRKSGKYVNGL